MTQPTDVVRAPPTAGPQRSSLPRYEEPPLGSVDVPTGAARFRRPATKIHALIENGLLEPIGRLNKTPPLLLVDERALGDALRLDKLVPVYRNVPPTCISLPDASTVYGISRSTLQTWVNRGFLRMVGRLQGAARGGGFVLIDIGELEAFLVERPQRVNDLEPSQAASGPTMIRTTIP